MKERGWRFDLDEDPYIALVEKCRRSEAQKKVAANPGPRGVEISGGSDKANFDDCMKQRGVGGR